jgi:ATP-binding cassette subfamily B protein
VSTASPAVMRRGLGVLAVAIRAQPRLFALAIMGSALYAAAGVGAAFVLGAITTHVVLPAFEHRQVSAGALVAAAAAIIATAVVKVLGVVGRRVCAGTMQYRMQAQYRREVAGRYLDLPLSWHARHPTGNLLSVANSDVEAAWAPIAPFPFAIGTLFMLVITAVALVVTDPVMAVVGFVVFPLIIVLTMAFSRRMSPRITRAQELRAELSGVALESIDGALVVKTLGREDHETERFAGYSATLRDANIGVGRLRGTFDPLMEAIPTIGTLLILLVGSMRVQSGAAQVGDLVSIAYLFSILAFPVRAIGWVLGELPRSVVGWARIRHVLDAAGQQVFGSDRLRSGPGAGAARIEARDIGFGYARPDVLPDDPLDAVAAGEAGLDTDRDEAAAAGRPDSSTQLDPVLDGVTLEAPPGQIVAVVGATGAGKSTLLTLLVRLIDPDRGSVRLDGTDVRALAEDQMPAHASLVAQSAFLFDDTVRGNITLDDPQLGEQQVWDALRVAQAEDFVRALPKGLDTELGERGVTLSGGQRQRLALARAVVRRPRLLLMDDATSAVDPAVEAAILRELRQAQGLGTVVVVAYRRATITLADEVVYLEGGRVAAAGRHEQLLAESSGYRALVTAYDQPVGA